jgi:hypothetical protein
MCNNKALKLVASLQTLLLRILDHVIATRICNFIAELLYVM